MSPYASIAPGIHVPLGEDRRGSYRVRQTAREDKTPAYEYYRLPDGVLISIRGDLSRGSAVVPYGIGNRTVQARRIELFRADDFSPLSGSEPLQWGPWTESGTVKAALLDPQPGPGRLRPYVRERITWAIAALTAEEVADVIRRETIAALDAALDSLDSAPPQRGARSAQVARWRAIRRRLATEIEGGAR